MAVVEDAEKIRSRFYGKAGFKTVEEAKSIDSLINKKFINISKLRDFCSRHSIPATQRGIVWKLLLGVLSDVRDNHDFRINGLKQENYLLTRYVKVLARVIFRGREHELTEHQYYYLRWLLYRGRITLGSENNFEEDSAFSAILDNMFLYFCDDTERFFSTVLFYEKIMPVREQLTHLIEITYLILRDHRLDLFQQLQKIKVLDEVPLERWYKRCFAGILHESSVAKLWDKIMAGVTFKILCYVGAATLIKTLIGRVDTTDRNAVLKALKNISEDDSEPIIQDVFHVVFRGSGHFHSSKFLENFQNDI